MCLNQVDHVFKPSLFFGQNKGGAKNTIKQGKMKVDHVFKRGLVVGGG